MLIPHDKNFVFLAQDCHDGQGGKITRARVIRAGIVGDMHAQLTKPALHEHFVGISGSGRIHPQFDFYLLISGQGQGCIYIDVFREVLDGVNHATTEQAGTLGGIRSQRPPAIWSFAASLGQPQTAFRSADYRARIPLRWESVFARPIVETDGSYFP